MSRLLPIWTSDLPHSSGAYDEAFGPDRKPRAPQAQLAEAARQIPVDEFLRRSAQAEEQLRENGVTFNVFQEGSQHQRPWRLDLLPVIYARRNGGSSNTG